MRKTKKNIPEQYIISFLFHQFSNQKIFNFSWVNTIAFSPRLGESKRIYQGYSCGGAVMKCQKLKIWRGSIIQNANFSILKWSKIAKILWSCEFSPSWANFFSFESFRHLLQALLKICKKKLSTWYMLFLSTSLMI